MNEKSVLEKEKQRPWWNSKPEKIQNSLKAIFGLADWDVIFVSEIDDKEIQEQILSVAEGAEKQIDELPLKGVEKQTAARRIRETASKLITKIIFEGK